MTDLIIREVTVSDSDELLTLRGLIDRETDFMLREADELPGREKHHEWILGVVANPTQAVFVAELGGKLVGYSMCFGGGLQRLSKTGTIVIGILKEHHRKGMGKELFEQIISWAQKQGFHRLELEVDTGNTPAIQLYEKMGFEIEGVRKDAVCIRDEYKDLYMMAKIL